MLNTHVYDKTYTFKTRSMKLKGAIPVYEKTSTKAFLKGFIYQLDEK